MTTKRAGTVTAMSCFLALGLIAGCMRIESTDGSGGSSGGGGHPLPDAYVPPGTSLAGSIGCGSFACGPQTMCTQQYSGLDAGLVDDAGTPSDPTYSCTTVPTSCRIYDCYSDGCSQCIRDLCYYGAYWGVSVSGRYLTCPGV